MRLRIVHETRYEYEEPARGVIQALRMTPRGHDGQHVRRWRIEPSVDGRLEAKEDSLGNLVHVFSAEVPASELVIRVTGEVDTYDTHGIVRGAVERAPDLYYLRETPLTETDEALRALAAEAFEGRDAVAGLHALLAAVHGSVACEAKRSDKAVTAKEAFALRRGVSRDLTHVFMAAARHAGVPTRYVSGYFFRADSGEQEAGHAWAEAKAPGLGWLGFDPANGVCIGPAHLRVAVGLDYLGAAPIRGSRYGGGDERLAVALRVENTQSQTQG